MSRLVKFLAMDLGAESGRAILASFDGDRISSLEEIHRFSNAPIRVVGGLYWDALRIMGEVKRGLEQSVQVEGELASAGVDSWAVDFALLDHEGRLVSNPLHYRDARTEGMIERALERMPREEIYGATGIQFIRINTLYQLLSMGGSPLLEASDRLLLIPDLINYWLTGEAACEFTNATTTQLYNSKSRSWAEDIIEKMHIPLRIFPEVVPPGTLLGHLLPEVAEEVGGGTGLPVICVASHDTASAVIAVPAEAENFAYISSGTWSLVGLETPEPILTQEAMEANFTNEGGFGGTTRFLKNVMGLWLLQECRRSWINEGWDCSYDKLEHLAEETEKFGPLVDPDHPTFLVPGDMPSRIRRFCEATGQRPPNEPGQIARCVFESLALKYERVLLRACEIAGCHIDVIHVVGGGSQNELLCRLTAEATRRVVLAGPTEATALGNVMVQAHARDYVGSLEDIREVVRRSIVVDVYEPGADKDRWAEARDRFAEICDTVPTLAESAGG